MSIKVKKGNEWITLAGVKGTPGESAYEHAKKGGFIGTEEEFNKKLANAGNDSIIIDDVPTNCSKNAVSSSGVYNAIEEVKSQIENIAPEDLSAYLTKEEANETFAVKGNYQEKLVEGETPLFNVTSSEIDGVVTVAYGNTLDLGNLKGADGKDGVPGEDGKDGTDGADGKDGVDGISSFTSFAFARSIDPLSTPEGGSFDNPKPDGDAFYDSIPEGTDPVWMSKCTFYSNVDYSTNKAQWSNPVMMADTPEFEVMYSSKDTQPEIPEGFDNSDSWWESANTAGWTDEPSDESPIWMATSKKSFGKWSYWTVSKIKGEKGEKGEDGKDGVDGAEGPQGPQGPAGSDGKDGNTVSTTVYYTNHNDDIELGYTIPENIGSDLSVLTNAGWTTDFNSVFNNINPDNSKYYSMIVSIYYVDGNVEHITLHEVESHTTTINQGRDGKMVYPAGEYSSESDYQATSTTAPYVYIKNGNEREYYIYNTEVSWLSVKEDDNLAESDYWVKMESYNALQTEILIADNGTINDAVFNSGYMFSKSGKQNGKSSEEYYNFIYSENLYETDSAFKPNTLLDFNTGKAVFGCGDTILAKDGVNLFRKINCNEAISTQVFVSDVYNNGIYSTIRNDGNSARISSGDSSISLKNGKIYISENNTEKEIQSYIIDLISDFSKNNISISTESLGDCAFDKTYTLEINGSPYTFTNNDKGFSVEIPVKITSQEEHQTSVQLYYPVIETVYNTNPFGNKTPVSTEEVSQMSNDVFIDNTSTLDVRYLAPFVIIKSNTYPFDGTKQFYAYVRPSNICSGMGDIKITFKVSC